jgi:hypothetical protein
MRIINLVFEATILAFVCLHYMLNIFLTLVIHPIEQPIIVIYINKEMLMFNEVNFNNDTSYDNTI